LLYIIWYWDEFEIDEHNTSLRNNIYNQIGKNKPMKNTYYNLNNRVIRRFCYVLLLRNAHVNISFLKKNRNSKFCTMHDFFFGIKSKTDWCLLCMREGNSVNYYPLLCAVLQCYPSLNHYITQSTQWGNNTLAVKKW
jgi:hypothetical protein